MTREPALLARTPRTAGCLVAIGASAGGPAAVATVLGGLPKDFSAPIVVIQHVDERFARHIAQWLSESCTVQVRVAEEGDRPVAGTALLAGTNSHLILTGPERLGYSNLPIHALHRPSVDAFFNSICEHWRGEAIGVLLTGMGRDGAEGLKALREKGHHTIAQDQASSAVYGMPKEAARINAAVEILAIERIAPRLAALAGIASR